MILRSTSMFFSVLSILTQLQIVFSRKEATTGHLQKHLRPLQDTICVDAPETWLDRDGYTCQQYEENDWCGNSQNPDFADENGIDGDQACCLCGGGEIISPVARPGHSTTVDEGCCLAEEKPAADACTFDVSCCQDGQWRCNGEFTPRCAHNGGVCEGESSSSPGRTGPGRTSRTGPPRTEDGDEAPETGDSGLPMTGDSTPRESDGTDGVDDVVVSGSTDSPRETDGVQDTMDDTETFDQYCGCTRETVCLVGDIFDCEFVDCCREDEECILIMPEWPESGGTCQPVNGDVPETSSSRGGGDNDSPTTRDLCDIELTGFPTLNAIYELESGLEAGHPFYFSGEVYLYFREPENIWFFGPQRGGQTVFAKSLGESRFPQNVEHWRVWNGQEFIRDPSFRIECVSE